MKAGDATMKTKAHMQSFLFILPQLVGFLVFGIYPIVWVLIHAFYDYDGLQRIFTGLDNLTRVFLRDADYWHSLVNTLILSGGKLVVELPLALVLALILNTSLRGRSFFRAMFFMPNIISSAIIGLVFYFMFATFEGIVNNGLLAAGLIQTPVDWFANKWTAMSILGLSSIWQNFGINMLFFLAGLLGIPKELYECSEIDGAGRWKQFIHITIPMLGPVMQVVCMMAIIGSMKVTDLVLVLTNGQPAGGTEVVMTYIFKKFFNYGGMDNLPQVGYTCALGLVTSVILGIITVFYLRMTKNMSTID
ncbi:MAG: hypothetical protein K0R57_3421 [Paenibacillaceae bacterium]|jgi:raffinose/stachyose/melibiose transport system permease protein|nr:hypothetical protein [Paenibacillaceae bacterium]